MRRLRLPARLAGLALAAALVALPATAAAEEELPAGSLGVVFGAREGVGRLGAAYTPGLVWGVQAGYHPTSLAQNWSIGAAWSVLWGRLWSQDPAVSDGTLKLLEMNLALRVRRLMSATDPVYLTLSPLGVSVIRANIPMPPDGERLYVGPYAGVGGEMFLREKFALSVEARYGVFTGGPGGVTFLLGVSVGSR